MNTFLLVAQAAIAHPTADAARSRALVSRSAERVQQQQLPAWLGWLRGLLFMMWHTHTQQLAQQIQQQQQHNEGLRAAAAAAVGGAARRR